MGIKSFGRRSQLAVLAAFAVSLTDGCGGSGGGSSSSTPGTQLSFSVNWEQSSAAVGSIAPSSAAAPLAFDTPIPAAVNAIRFILRPSAGSACCIAVLRGSQAFIDRHILLANVTPGDSTLEVNGYPTDFAPSDGVGATCATSDGEGVACEDEETLPSFGSDEVPIDVVAGVRNVVDVDVHSLPFLLDLDPADGETAESNRPRIRFAVVDANFGIDEDIDVHVDSGEVSTDAEIVNLDPCADDDSELPDCSAGGALDVSGFLVTARPPVVLPAGTADLTIQASNTAEPQRSMESNTTFIVPGATTTTTTVSSTTSSTTITSTTELITTTTLDNGEETFCLTFRVTNTADYVGVAYTVSYGATGGEFVGSGEDVDCELLLDSNPESTLASFNDDDTDSSNLFTAIISGEPFSGPVDLARCVFQQAPPLVLSNFTIQVTEATAPDLSPASATVIVEETQCPQ